MCQQYPNAYRKNCVPVRVFYLTRQGLWLSLTGFFIFASIKPNTPLIQAHFVGSFRLVVRFVVILATGFFLFIFTFVSFVIFT